MYFTRRRFVPPFGRLGLLLLAIAFVAHRATATLAQTAACTGVSLSDSPPFQAPIGTPVTLAASSTGCFSPQYRFWVEAPGQPWTLMQDYSFGSAFTWDTRDLPAGDYNVEADARGWGSTADVEAYQVQAYALQPLPACSLRGLGTRPAGQARAGTPVVLIASSSGCPAPQYRFWVEAPGQPWTLMQDYSYLSSFVWNTAGQQAGSYNLEVDVREAGSQAYVDSYLVLPYTLQASQTLRGCASVSLSTNPSSPTPAGSFVTLRAASSGCPSPQYRFWVEVPGQPWTLMQDYSSRSSFIWNTAGLPTGSYNLEVDVRQAGSQAYVESYVVNAYSLLSP